MPSLHGRLEARIVVPTGGWADAGNFTLTESAPVTSAQNITITAGNYWWNKGDGAGATFLAQLKANLEAASGNSRTYTVTLSSGELGTGLLTIAVSSGTFAIAWGSGDGLTVRNLCGYNGDIGPSASEESTNHVQAMWLPDCPVNSPTFLSTAASNTGLLHSAAVVTLSEDGTYYSWHGSSHRRTELTWEMVTKAKTWLAGGAAADNETYEEFWMHAVRAEKAWAQAGRQIKFYPDTTVASAKTFNVLNVTSPEITIVDASYDGWWRIRLEVAEN